MCRRLYFKDKIASSQGELAHLLVEIAGKGTWRDGIKLIVNHPDDDGFVFGNCLCGVRWAETAKNVGCVAFDLLTDVEFVRDHDVSDWKQEHVSEDWRPIECS
jgi:hypothetical protein